MNDETQAQCCEVCDNGDGQCAYPQYGVGPHICFHQIPGAKIGESVPLEPAKWPANFVPDPDTQEEGSHACLGIYTHCLNCGRGDPPALTNDLNSITMSIPA